MGFILTLSARMIFSDKDDLVEKDYYEKGLNYDQQYQQKQNVIHDEAAPELEVESGLLKLRFKIPVTGTARFAHSSDKNLDWELPINTATAVIPVQGLEKGQWRLILNWQGDGKKYQFEKVVQLK